MYQTNQLLGEFLHYKHWFEPKNMIWKSDEKTKVQGCVLNGFNEGKNYNPHDALQSNKNNGELLI